MAWFIIQSQIEYITMVLIFLVIATAAPSNKKIFSDEFLNELKDEIVGKVRTRRIKVCINTCLYTSVAIINTSVGNRKMQYSDKFYMALVLGMKTFKTFVLIWNITKSYKVLLVNNL